jgi:PAS domain S-box-containing protein
MVESSQDWFWEFDENANFTYASPRVKDLLGYEPEELIGLNAFDLMNFYEAKRVHSYFDPIAKKYLPFRNLVNINIHKDGHEVVIESSGTPIFSEEGHFLGYRGIDRDITERMEMEENYRRIARLTSDYVYCCTRTGSSEFQIKWVDGATKAISGYSIEDLLALGCFLPMVHPDDRQRVSGYLRSLVPGDKKTIEFRIVTQQQELRWVWEKSQCMAGQRAGELILLGAVTDITERKRSEERLRVSEGRFRNIVEMLPEVVFELDLRGHLKFSNRKAFELFGYSEDDFLRGLTAFEMVVPEERSVAREKIRQRLAGEAVGAMEYSALRKDGSTFPVILNAVPIMKGLEPVGLLGIMTDITERKSNEMALLAATQVAETASRAKALFLAKVSHEIRTPLTAIIGFSELLEAAELTPEYKKYLAAISASGSALASLVDDVLDLSKVEAGELAIKPQDFSLHNLITKMVATQKQHIEKKNLSITTSIDNAVPDLLIGDPLRIQQVVLNLLRNAIKFTEKGDIVIAASVGEESGLRVLLDIAVKDTGVGISANMQEQIFEPFVQVINPKNPNYGGSGLGLTISRSLAGLMGGSIRVESREGVGSTFHLLVPLKRKKDSLSKKPLPEKELTLWSGPILKVLLAEDNPVNSHFIKTVLVNMGHTVAVAENGKVALDTLKANTFDLALIDIQMPVMNGPDLLSLIREMEQFSGKRLIVIALTAYALIGDKEKYLDMGFDGYLSKPFKTKDLIVEMTRVVPDR